MRWVEGEDESQGAGFAFWCGLSGAKVEDVRHLLRARNPEAFEQYAK